MRLSIGMCAKNQLPEAERVFFFFFFFFFFSEVKQNKHFMFSNFFFLMENLEPWLICDILDFVK